MIQIRESVVLNKKENKYCKIVQDQQMEFEWIVMAPVICGGDVIGAVLIMIKEEGKKPKEAELILAKTAADFLGRQMES